MINTSYDLLQNVIQICIYSLALSLILLYITTLPRRSMFFSALTFMTLLLCVNIVPLYRGNSLVEIFRGGIGDVSIASGMFMLLYCAKMFSPSPQQNSILAWWEKLVLLLIGFALYLSTLGFVSVDIYHFGYLSSRMIPFFCGATLISILLKRKLGYVWLIAIIGYYIGAQESNNMWDYLYDPILWLFMVSDSLVKVSNFVSKKKHLIINRLPNINLK